MMFTLKNPIYRSLILIGIAVSFINSNAAVKQENSTKDESSRIIASENKLEPVQNDYVIVEPLNVMTELKSGEYRLVPYKYRREPWGGSVNIGYSFFNPINYEPDFQAPSFGFENLYGSSADSPLIELTFVYKKNFTTFSIGGELSIGSFSTSANPDGFDDKLVLMPIRLGAVLELDAIMKEPYVVPYVIGGGYIMKYKETQASSVLDGNNAVAPYWGAGVKLQISWVERDTSRIAYEENGMENTFIFVEGRQLLASSAEQDKDFSTDPFITVGLSLEF